MTIFGDLGLFLWRLLPGNPIVVRVVATGGKRTRHMWARFFYLAVLFVVMLFAGGALFGGTTSLADLAKNSTRIFVIVSGVQLALMSFVAPIFTAGAITQERDSNTFDILLTTPLSNAQIVLGSLLSRLFFVWMLLLSGLPIFCITMIYGGVTAYEVFQSFALAASTGLLTGAMAISIAMLKIGTRRTIFAFFLGIAMYLLGVGALGWSGYFAVPEAPPSTSLPGLQMSQLAPFHPFLALAVVTGQTPAPPAADVARYGWPWAWLYAQPHAAYIVLTTLASVGLVVLSLLFVRRGQKEGETTWWTQITSIFATHRAGERSHAPRRVWGNPIAWREAVTRGTALTRNLMRWGFIAGGLALGFFLLTAYDQGWLNLQTPGGIPQPAEMRSWLTVIVWIELAIILLVVTNTAAGTLTRERESQTMEILLTTPLTSHYIVAGMLQGLVRFTIPLIAVPTGTVLIFVLADLLRPGPDVLSIEALVLLPLVLVAYCALAAIVGLHFSLTATRTVRAVMISTTIVLGGNGLLWACGLAMGSTGAQTAAVVLPFTPFPAVQAILDVPALFGVGATTTAGQLMETRLLRLVTTLVAAAVYLGITFALYQNMVKNFDRVIRAQSAST